MSNSKFVFLVLPLALAFGEILELIVSFMSIESNWVVHAIGGPMGVMIYLFSKWNFNDYNSQHEKYWAYRNHPY